MRGREGDLASNVQKVGVGESEQHCVGGCGQIGPQEGKSMFLLLPWTWAICSYKNCSKTKLGKG